MEAMQRSNPTQPSAILGISVSRPAVKDLGREKENRQRHSERRKESQRDGQPRRTKVAGWLAGWLD